MLRFAVRLVIFCFALVAGAPLYAADAGHTTAKQAVMIDYDTGMTLFEKAADENMPTSSMSKVMTMYMVFGALKEGRISLEQEMPVSEKAWRMGGSKMFVEVGKRVKVEDLVRGVVVQSGNDATVVLAEGLSGSEDSFAQEMNIRAQELGMKDSHFVNASGWPDPEHYSTARDLALLAKHTISDFPEYYHYYAETEFTYNNIKQANRNPLLYRNIGADGIKTGHTEAGGYGLMASGKNGDGRRVVLVVNGLPDEKARAEESARLLEWGLKGFMNLQLFKAGEAVDQAYVLMGKQEQVPLVVEQDIIVTLPHAVKNGLKVEAVYEAPLMAPVKKGQKVGVLKIEVPRVTSFEVPLIAGADAGSLGFIAGAFAKAKLLLGGGAEIQ